MEYNSSLELYNSLFGAFEVKLHLAKSKDIDIKKIDIWNYLKINKWSKDKNLTISEMVNDIINVDPEKVNAFIQNRN